jgi:outer membrane protein W
MKAKIIIIAIVTTISGLYAQNEDFKRIEFDASLNFWTPSSTHMKGSNSVTQVYANNSYMSYGGINGYGSSFAPTFNLTYFFKNNIGISLGFYPLSMDNELKVKTTDTTFSNYENYASISNLKLGITGRMSTSTSFNFYYGFGINFIPNYDLMITSSNESVDPADIEAIDSAVGFYLRTGLKTKIYKSLYLNTSAEYTYIPTELEYNSTDNVIINEKTNLGGLSIQIGLSYSFLK